MLSHLPKYFSLLDIPSHIKGKWAVSYGSVVVVSLQEIRDSVKEMLKTYLPKDQPRLLSLIKELDTITMSYFILSNHHHQIYSSSDMIKFIDC